jgi:hypothetical protein
VPSLEDFFGFFCRRGGSESDPELVVEPWQLDTGDGETRGTSERYLTTLSATAGLPFVSNGGLSSEEVE